MVIYVAATVARYVAIGKTLAVIDTDVRASVFVWHDRAASSSITLRSVVATLSHWTGICTTGWRWCLCSSRSRGRSRGRSLFLKLVRRR